MKTELQWLTPEAVQNLHDELVPFFQRVVDAHPDGAYSVPGILFKLYRGEWVCWIITSGDEIIGVTSTCVTFDMKFRRVMRIMFLAGDHWLKWGPRVLKEFEQHGIEHEIYCNEFVGRDGFQRKLPDYQIVGNIYRKVLNEEAPLMDAVRPNVIDVGRA